MAQWLNEASRCTKCNRKLFPKWRGQDNLEDVVHLTYDLKRGHVILRCYCQSVQSDMDMRLGNFLSAVHRYVSQGYAVRIKLQGGSVQTEGFDDAAIEFQPLP